MPIGSSGRHDAFAGFGSNGVSPGGVFDTVMKRSAVRMKSTSW
jgi:hypothetical protein